MFVREKNEKKSPPVRKSRLGIFRVVGPRAGEDFVNYCLLPFHHYSLVAPALFCSCRTVVDAHAIVRVLQAPEVLVWTWTQHPAIVLPVDVEDTLGPVLVLVDLPAMQGLASGIVEPHPIPLNSCCWSCG